jgi:hypothetical protein
MPFDPGTLEGYDQVISISQEAINRQLEVLYQTELDQPTPNGARHLINHEMHFHKRITEEENEWVEEQGIDAYVCCPRIELGGETVTDKGERFRVAVIRFKFRQREEWEAGEDTEKPRDSILCYEYKRLVRGERPNLEYPYVIINDWEISWETLIASEDIQSVMEGL